MKLNGALTMSIIKFSLISALHCIMLSSFGANMFQFETSDGNMQQFSIIGQWGMHSL